MWCPHSCCKWNQWCCSQFVLMEVSCLYLWSPGWFLKVLFEWHTYVFHERASTNFFFFPRNEGRWDQGILLCADTSQEWQAAALGIHGSQAWSLARTSRLPEKSSSQHKRGWKREGKNLHFSELHLSLKNGQLLNSLKARLCFIYLSLARAKYPVQSRSSCRMRE